MGREAQADIAETTQDLLTKLLSGLAALDPADRREMLADMLRMVERAPSGDGQGPPLSLRCDWASPLLISDWAKDQGTEGADQYLSVDMSPRPAPIPKTRAATGESLVSNGFLGADLLHVPAGEGFAPHTHFGDHLLFVLAGEGTIAVDGAIRPTRAGQVYMIEGAVPHAVGAITDHVILSVGAKHRPLTSMDRQELVEYATLLSPLGAITCQICGVAASCGEELAGQGCGHSPHRFA